MTNDGIAALAPVIAPTITWVTGSNKTIKMIKGIERKTLTNNATIQFKALTAKLLLSDVS